MEKAAQIFLSYSSDDKDKVEILYNKLLDKGFKPWMDKKDLLGGENWDVRIKKAMRNSDFCLICLSKNSVSKRGFLQREIKVALDLWKEKLETDIYLIPVRLDDCEIPEALAAFQWIDLFKDEGWADVKKALHVGLKRSKKVKPGADSSPPPKFLERILINFRNWKWWYIASIAILIISAKFGPSFISKKNDVQQDKNNTVISIYNPRSRSDDKEINNIVKALAKKYRKNIGSVSKSADQWTSKPLGMVLLEVTGDNIDESQKDYILAKISSNLKASRRIKVVDRQLLDKLLTELSLSSSDLADPATQLKIGRILSAKLITTGRIAKEKDTWMVTLRIVETETTILRGVIASYVETQKPEILAQQVSEEIIKQVKSEYPIKTTIHSIIDYPEIILNIGSNVGVTAGLRLEILSQERNIRIGEIEIVAVEESRSRGKIVSEEEQILKGFKVREVM